MAGKDARLRGRQGSLLTTKYSPQPLTSSIFVSHIFFTNHSSPFRLSTKNINLHRFGPNIKSPNAQQIDPGAMPIYATIIEKFVRFFDGDWFLRTHRLCKFIDCCHHGKTPRQYSILFTFILQPSWVCKKGKHTHTHTSNIIHDLPP